MKKFLSLLLVALLALTSLSCLAYDGEIITITADSDDEPFSWDPENDALAALIVDRFGINFEQSETNYYNNDFTVTQLAAVDGNLPDVFAADILYYTQEITEFIPEELVAEIPEALLEKYPLTKALLENDEVSQIVYNMYDGYYFLPKPDSADPSIYKSERKGLFIRKDWLEALNLSVPTSWEELYEVCHAFTYGDPDGNGINDTYGLTGDGLGTLRYFFSACGTSVANKAWNKNEDGTWEYGALNDGIIEVLEWLRKMYEDGSIDPDFAATTWKQGLQKFSSNQFGVCVRNADADWINGVMTKYYGAANPDCNPFDRITMIPALSITKGGTVYMEQYTSCMVATMFSYEITEEKMDRFLAYYEYLLSEEGQLLRMGLEGVDYVKDADGNVTKVRDENGNAPALAIEYPSIPVTHWCSWGFELAAYQNVEYFDLYNDETKALNAECCAIRNENPTKVYVGPMLIDDTAVTDAIGAFSTNSEYWAIITGTEPVADMFAAMKAKALASGLAEAAEVVQEYAEKYGW